MLRLANFSRSALRSSLREDTNKHGSYCTPQFLFWFNESPGHFTPAISVPASRSPPGRSSTTRSKSAQSLVFREFTEHQQEEGGQFEEPPLYSLCRVANYGAILAVGYNIFHDKTLFRAVQEWSERLYPLHLYFPQQLETHCPVLNVKHQKIALAQPLDSQSRGAIKDSVDCCNETRLYKDEIFENTTQIKEPSETSDYSSHKSESQIERYQLSEEELRLLEIQDSIPHTLDDLIAIRLLKNGDKEGMKQLKQLSNLGCSTSQFYLGQVFEFGILVTSNLTVAAKYYKEAALGGHPEAKYNLGVFYLKGDGGCEYSEQEGMKLIREAAQLGLTEAMSFVKEPEEEINVKTPSLHRVELDQLFHSGKVMEESESYHSVDQLFALELYKVAAENGHKTAKNNYRILAEKISKGRSTEPHSC